MTVEEFEAEKAAMSDYDLIRFVDEEISQLALTGGKSHKMSVPPKVTDTDMLLSELLRRYKDTLEIPTPPSA